MNLVHFSAYFYKYLISFKMGKLINYIILPEIKLIVENYKGVFTSVDAINYKKIMKEDNVYDPSFNIITDLRELEMHVQADVDIKELSVYLDFLKNTPVERKVALLTIKPNQAVLAHLFKEMARDTIIEYEVFSTLNSAIQYVGLPLIKSDIINVALEKLSCSKSIV
jgi:hypothetical protein